MKIELKNVSLQYTKRDKFIIHLSLSNYELNELLLQSGKQPQTLFNVIIHKKGEY